MAKNTVPRKKSANPAAARAASRLTRRARALEKQANALVEAGERCLYKAETIRRKARPRSGAEEE